MFLSEGIIIEKIKGSLNLPCNFLAIRMSTGTWIQWFPNCWVWNWLNVRVNMYIKVTYNFSLRLVKNTAGRIFDSALIPVCSSSGSILSTVLWYSLITLYSRSLAMILWFKRFEAEYCSYRSSEEARKHSDAGSPGCAPLAEAVTASGWLWSKWETSGRGEQGVERPAGAPASFLLLCNVLRRQRLSPSNQKQSILPGEAVDAPSLGVETTWSLWSFSTLVWFCDPDVQEHWWHCFLSFRHHVPQKEEETPWDLSSAELWASCPHFVWPKRGQICGPATSMAEYSRHAEAPQASCGPFKDHPDAAPAYEGKRRGLLFPVPWASSVGMLRDMYSSRSKDGVHKEFTGWEVVCALVTLFLSL